MPLGENHILILLKEEAIQDTKIQVIHLVMWLVSQEEMML
jgi:hypothetical protein